MLPLGTHMQYRERISMATIYDVEERGTALNDSCKQLKKGKDRLGSHCGDF